MSCADAVTLGSRLHCTAIAKTEHSSTENPVKNGIYGIWCILNLMLSKERFLIKYHHHRTLSIKKRVWGQWTVKSSICIKKNHFHALCLGTDTVSKGNWHLPTEQKRGPEGRFIQNHFLTHKERDTFKCFCYYLRKGQ